MKETFCVTRDIFCQKKERPADAGRSWISREWYLRLPDDTKRIGDQADMMNPEATIGA